MPVPLSQYNDDNYCKRDGKAETRERHKRGKEPRNDLHKYNPGLIIEAFFFFLSFMDEGIYMYITVSFYLSLWDVLPYFLLTI